MRIIARGTLQLFSERHPETWSSLQRWYQITKAAKWDSTNDVLATFPKATVLNAERVRFEVAGGNFRMIAAFRFDLSIVWIKFLGTHTEYDRIDALTVSQY